MVEEANDTPPFNRSEQKPEVVKKPEAPPLSPAEIESMIKIREAVERELLWKYAVGALIVGGLLTGGAAAGFLSVYSTSHEFFAIAKDRVDEVKKDSKALLDDFHTAERRLQEERSAEEDKFQKSVLDLTRQIDEQKKQTEVVSAKILDAQGQSATLQNQTAKAIEGLKHAAEVVAALDKTHLSNEVQAEIEQVQSAAIRSQELADNARFTVFPHYNRSSPTSAQFRQTARGALADEGFVVASDSADSSVAPTKGNGGKVVEGPHVSYFIDAKQPDVENDKIRQAAQRVADLLNEKLPPGFGPFETKEHKDQPSQSHYFGLWF